MSEYPFSDRSGYTFAAKRGSFVRLGDGDGYTRRTCGHCGRPWGFFFLMPTIWECRKPNGCGRSNTEGSDG